MIVLGLAALSVAWASAGDRAPLPARAVTIEIETDHPLGPISPFIYGVAQASVDDLTSLHVRLHRWGGNPSSRYNWELGNAWNAARDWEFRNGNYGNTRAQDTQPSG